MRTQNVLTFLMLSWTSSALAAGPSLESVIPAIGQRGTEFTLKVVGAGLSDAQEILLYSAGVQCLELKAVNDNELSVRLKASTDCPLGTHPFRVRTPQGVSELKIFRITPLSVALEVEPNEKPDQAMLVPRNVTIGGFLDKGDVDCFQVSLKRGERLSAEVEAVRLGARLVDTVLTIYGPDGKRLASVDDTPLYGQDPFLSLVAPSDGLYGVQVNEVNFEGDENSRYALHLGTFPRPASVYPAGGRVGERISVRFEGDASGALMRQITLPGSEVTAFGLFPEDHGQTPPTSIPFRVSAFENLLESEPNDRPDQIVVSASALPVAFNGILEKNGDVDCFRFRMTKGQECQFEAFADRIGSPVDTLISILDSDGTVLVANDDYGSHDSRLVFRAPSTGEFLFRISDQRGAGGGNYVYRVEAVTPQPAIVSFLPRPDRLSQERQAISVPRGNRVLTFLAVRRHGVDSEVVLAPQGLPQGVGHFVATVPADRYLVPVVIEASADAPIGGSLVRILANGKTDSTTVLGEFEQVVDLVNASADRLYQSASVDRLAMAVIEPAPFTIELERPEAILVKDGTVELTVRVTRSADFNGPVDVTFPFLPPWVDGPAKITIPADKTTGVYLAHAFPQAMPRTWQICAEARAAVAVSREQMSSDPAANPTPRRSRRGKKANDVPVASQLVDLSIGDSPVTGTIGRVAAEQGTTVQVVCSIERSGTVPDELEATLEGLPNRVQADPVQIGARDSAAKFQIRFDSTAPIGEFNSLVCRLSGKIKGQVVSYSVGRGGILTITSPGGLLTDAQGRPLTKLDALRQTQSAAPSKNPTSDAPNQGGR